MGYLAVKGLKRIGLRIDLETKMLTLTKKIKELQFTVETYVK